VYVGHISLKVLGVKVQCLLYERSV